MTPGRRGSSRSLPARDGGSSTTCAYSLGWRTSRHVRAHTKRARAAIAQLTEAEPYNGYLKYRLTHVLAELGDTEAAIRMLREAIRDGFLSVQLLRQEGRLGLSCLIGLTEYRQVRLVLQQNVDRARNKYAPS
jgi:hypothetical protein